MTLHAKQAQILFRACFLFVPTCRISFLRVEKREASIAHLPKGVKNVTWFISRSILRGDPQMPCRVEPRHEKPLIFKAFLSLAQEKAQKSKKL